MSTAPDRFADLPRPAPFPPEVVIRDLGDGMVLRRATQADIPAVAAFNRVGLADPPHYHPAEYLANWIPELMSGQHPRVRARDFTLVEDTRERCLASSLCLIPHRLCYGGVELGAGQPELVVTRPGYRRRGLVRCQLDVVHAWSEKRGDKLQLIDGIPWYYRQFGYEMALESRWGRLAPLDNLPTASPRDALRVRPAGEGDLAFLARLYERLRARDLLFCCREEADWRYQLTMHAPLSYARREHRIVEDGTGARLAAFAHYPVLIEGSLSVVFCEVADGVAWPSLTPRLLWALREAGAAIAVRRGGAPLAAVAFELGTRHPFYDAEPGRLPDLRRGYAYYVRVPRLAGFLEHVKPVLEQRLARSPAAGHTGEVAISMYRTGLRLTLEAGRIRSVTTWRPSTDERGDVALPDLTFLQLLFGYRSLDDLRESFPDCLIHDEPSAALVRALFPPQSSNLWLTW